MKKHTAAVEHLQRVDPIMKAWIDVAGPCLLKSSRARFEALVWAIISQQISAHVAKVIQGRVEALCGDEGLSPEALLRAGGPALRSAGCSNQKVAYLLDLSAKVGSGELPLNNLGRLSDDVVIERLTAVKGIGVWTAKMFLIFSLGRPDVFPHEDLAVRTALQKIYKLKKLPDRKRSERIAAKWKPHASVASWYCWRWHYVAGNYKPKQ